MFKNLIFTVIIILFSCNVSKEDAKGNFNDIVILASQEDKYFLESIIDKYIFIDTLYTPEPEAVYNKIWIEPDDFIHYKNFSNIIIAAIDDPIDATLDLLIQQFEEKNSNYNYPIFLKDVHAKNQIITIIKEDNKSSFLNAIDFTFELLSNSLKNHINNLYFNRYQSHLMDTTLSDVVIKNFNIDIQIRDDFKLINSSITDTLKYMWLGRGDIYSENSLYQWLLINSFNHNFKYDNYSLSNLIKNKISIVNPQIEIINDLDKFAFYENNTHNVFIVNSLYNHKTYLTGGPLIAFIIENKSFEENLIIFGLVNAPGQSKLKAIKELESIILNSIF